MVNFIAQKICEKRKENHMTQDQLAKKTCLHRNTIINFEKGKRNPRIKDLQNIANTLNISISDLFSQEE